MKVPLLVMRLRSAGSWLLVVSLLLGPHPAAAQSPGASDWGYYGGDVFGRRFSSLDQITRDNVGKLTLAWSYRTGEHLRAWDLHAYRPIGPQIRAVGAVFSLLDALIDRARESENGS